MSNRSFETPALAVANSFTGVDDGRAFPQALIGALREPLLVIDAGLRIVAANGPFCSLFSVDRQDIQGRSVYALSEGRSDAPELRVLFEEVLPLQSEFEAYEVELHSPEAGRRTLLFNARQLPGRGNARALILLTIEDVTEHRAAERRTAELLHQKEILVQEMQHRVANSLQIIASLLLLKARTVQSEETRGHLQDAHRRMLSVAAVQWQLYASQLGERIELAPYLSRLCEALAASMIGDNRPISLQVRADGGSATPAQAASIGLIVTELVINAIKHAFVGTAPGLIVVAYDAASPSWKLIVSDNGIGRPKGSPDPATAGLGTGIVEALARQLDARVEISMAPGGTSVSITHGDLKSSLS